MISVKQGSPDFGVCSDLSCIFAVCITDQEEPCFFEKYHNVSKSHQVFVHYSSSHVDRSSSSILSQKLFDYALEHFCLFVLLLYVPSQQLWSLWDGQFT